MDFSRPVAKTALVSVLTILFLTVVPFSIHAEVYKWVDDKGAIHFTDLYSTIPEKYLPFVETLELPEESSLPNVVKEPTPVLSPKSAVLSPKSPETLVDTTPRLFSGVISTVGSGAIVVTGKEEDMAFPISQDTKIVSDDGKNIPFAELKVKMSATVEYVKNGDDTHTLSIRVNTPPKGVPTRQKAHKK